MNIDPAISLLVQEALMHQLSSAELADIAEEDNLDLGHIASRILKPKFRRKIAC